MLFRHITSIYVLYFYLIGAGVISNLTAIPTALFNAHPLCRRLALTITPTLLFSN